jgi:hypothetical protein
MRPKPLLKEDILRAMRHTRSNMAAARYLGVSYQHYKPIAKFYKDEESGKSLFEIQKNQCGKGIPKQLVGSKKDPALDMILNGEIDPSHWSPERIKNRLIYENKIAEECAHCGLHDRRVLDYKMPLLLNHKNGNKKDWKLENLELLCYNCYFYQIGDVFTPQQVDVIEDVPKDKFNTEKPTFELDNNHLDNMKALGLI